MIRTKQDMDELTNFFTCGLFSPDTTLHCIVTGAVALTSVTVDDAQFTGMTILKDMVDQEVSDYTFLVSSKAKSLAARLEVEMNGTNVSAYPQLLFQHRSVASSSKSEGARQESFADELCR